MRRKKDLPLTILKSLEEFVTLKGEKFEVVNPDNHLLKIIDIDNDSDFSFIIEKYQKQNNVFQLLMSRSPRSEHDNGVYQIWIKIEQLKPQFQSWVNLLDQFQSVNSFFDDPILDSFKEEYYAEFEIVDEDAERKPLNTKQILLLDSHLEYIEEKIDNYKNEKNEEIVSEIKKEVVELRENLTSKSKKWVVNRLANIWAKLSKQGTKFIKDFVNQTKAEGIKQGAKALIEFIKDNGTELLG
jgi:ribonucleotide reductase beta subunit family protein with ferritin-like domain